MFNACFTLFTMYKRNPLLNTLLYFINNQSSEFDSLRFVFKIARVIKFCFKSSCIELRKVWFHFPKSIYLLLNILSIKQIKILTFVFTGFPSFSPCACPGVCNQSRSTVDCTHSTFTFTGIFVFMLWWSKFSRITVRAYSNSCITVTNNSSCFLDIWLYTCWSHNRSCGL